MVKSAHPEPGQTKQTNVLAGPYLQDVEIKNIVRKTAIDSGKAIETAPYRE